MLMVMSNGIKSLLILEANNRMDWGYNRYNAWWWYNKIACSV